MQKKATHLESPDWPVNAGVRFTGNRFNYAAGTNLLCPYSSSTWLLTKGRRCILIRETKCRRVAPKSPDGRSLAGSLTGFSVGGVGAGLET